MNRNIVIVGGGYIGAELARRLDPVADITLVEPRAAFVHAAAMIRAVVQPELLDRALLPYDNLLTRGRVIRERATAIDSDGVTLADGRRLMADIIVVATGSGYAAPFKPNGGDVDTLRQANAASHAAVMNARSVAIIGAGAVGIELAGEIKAARPACEVTLVSDTASLLPTYPPRLGAEMERQLSVLGVTLQLGRRVTALPTKTAPFSEIVSLDNGETIRADLVFPATGACPRTDLLTPLPDARIGADGRVVADRWMRPSALPNVLAAGDAVDLGDAMTIVATTRQVPWLERAIRSMLAGRQLDRTPPYTPWRNPPILLPLGPQMGASYLPPAGVQGPIPTRLIKGRALFVPKHRRQFGLGG
ncbi:NAD(P)/FAD-dependent oxidoreductase [Tropicimonas marinistellae]|uniref:NAD(P)/FAD-dependent oxidoreductase n=1 Tax=Tropicimonas marinistellae TaxID=1739787 RepID=UPI00082EA5DC|nr:FAD-dependent oxidoreductase [Tropicimonas marinistellae]